MKRKREELCEEDNEYGDGVGWIRGRILGKGSFGSVHKATPKSGLSFMPAEMAVKSAETSVSSTLWDEKEILRRLKGCAYVIQCYGAETTTVGDKMAYNLLLEYASGGTLADRIRELGRLPEAEVKAHTWSLLKGLCHIHGLGFVHCDLKPENILLVPKGGEGGGFRAKIGDFGLAKKKMRRKRRRREEEGQSCRGTPMYLAPECVTRREQEAPADMWALGCVVLEMLTGKQPWEGQKEEDILARIGSEIPEIPESLKGVARNFILGCFEQDPDFRFTAKSLFDHPFVDHQCPEFEDDCESREGDEFSSDEEEEEEYDDWLLSSAKIPFNEEAFVGNPVAFPVAAGV